MRVILCCVLAVAACGGGDGGDGDDDGGNVSDAASSNDAFPSSDAQASTGLTVTWTAQPMLPGRFSDVTISRVKLRLARLEVIGDTGSSSGTTLTDFDVIWSATTTPLPISFFSAEPGLYSRASLQIDGKVVARSYEIRGTVVINGTTEPFEISDTAALAVDVSGYNVTLMAGQAVEVPIHVDMDNAIDAVDFASLPTVANVRTMDQMTPGIAAVRTALETSTFSK